MNWSLHTGCEFHTEDKQNGTGLATNQFPDEGSKKAHLINVNSWKKH